MKDLTILLVRKVLAHVVDWQEGHLIEGAHRIWKIFISTWIVRGIKE